MCEALAMISSGQLRNIKKKVLKVVTVETNIQNAADKSLQANHTGVSCSVAMPRERKDMSNVVAKLSLIRDVLTGTRMSRENPNIRHRNLIKIISCCDELDFKALILQLMPNGSLEKWLYSPNRSMTILQGLDIKKDVALALEYLHHGYLIPIVHCDVKPSNILLDDDMVAHVADFGIARLIGNGDSVTETMTLATVGYMAPEFGMEGSVSTRGDVYSFGIVLMETFTKRKPTYEMFVGEMDLKHWIADSLFPDVAIGEVVDADILGAEEDGDFVSRSRGGSTVGSSGSNDPLETMETTLKLPYATSWSWGRRGRQEEEEEASRATCRRDCLSSVMRLALACSAALPGQRINMKDAAITLTKIKTKYLKDCGGVNS
ncbi:hypothetical protein DVH24_002706 [Malus domestica]|uniref:Protein kinase domain-containing protein n=1 Tax=Malus domestica TaxID=3750 RepID=A0A498K5C2_MALDO|nr:hypothetical protein DVH24_002706 [Malus domestica]